MTAGEQRLLRLELEVLLKRLKRNLNQVGVEVLKSTYRKGYGELLREIQVKAETYMKEAVFSGMGGYFCRDEIPDLCRTLNGVVNEAGIRHQLSVALFQEPDMGKVEGLVQIIRERVQRIVLEYQGHIQGGRQMRSIF